jgi:HEAT repeat protein
VHKAGEKNRLQKLDELIEASDRDAQLSRALSDADALVRRRAVVLSARFMEPAALIALLRVNDNASLRSSALSALRRQVPYCFEALRAACHDQDPDVAICAMEILSCGRDRDSWVLLEELSNHADENVQAAALEAMGKLGDPRALSTLVRALSRGSWQRMAAIAGLGELRNGEATPILLATLSDPETCDLTIAALGRLGDQAAIAPLAHLAEQTPRASTFYKIILAVGALVAENPNLSTEARLSLHHLCTTSRVAQLELLLRAGELRLAQVATRLMLAVGAGDSVVELLMIRATREPEAWSEVLALYRDNVEHALPALLLHADTEVRIKALEVAQHARAGLDLVVRSTEHDDPRIRAAACVLLGKSGHVQAASFLVARLARGVDAERTAAVEALRALGRASLDTLTRALHADPDPETRARLLTGLAATVDQNSDVGLITDRVVEWVQSGPAAQRRAALAVCAALARSTPHPALELALDDDDATVSGDAARHLARLGHVGPILARLPRAHAARFRWIASLGVAGRESSALPLIALFDSAHAHERITIAGALARIGGSDSVRFLSSKVDDTDVTIRRVAAEVVCTSASVPPLDLLSRLALDDDWVVRKWAVAGLTRNEGQHAHMLLVQLARDVDDMVCEAARSALGHGMEACS